jgi:hypothetical protein
VIDRILAFEQSLWLIALALYLVDVARLVTPGRLLLRETGGGRFRPVLVSFPFEFGGHELTIAGAFIPWRAVFMARWRGAAPPSVLGLAQADALLGGLAVLRLASCANFVLLFIVAPILTARSGLGIALLVVAPVVYLLNVGVGVRVLLQRSGLGLRMRQAGSLLFDALLCAPYGANWTQRVARLQPELAPMFAQLRERIAPADFERVSSAIALRQQQPGATER